MVTERYKKALDRARQAKFEVLTTWHYFQMKKDPFLTPIEKDSIKHFVGREKIVEEIIFQIGVAARGIPMTILLVGPHGVGKTSVINFVKSIVEEIAKESSEKYNLQGDLFSAKYLFSLPEEVDDENISTQPWLIKAGLERDYLLIDDAKPNQIKTINREFVKSKLKVFVVSPLDFEEAINSLNFTPKVILVNPLSFEDSIQMLEKRVQITVEKLEKELQIEQLFKNEALKQIWGCSMGIPLLMLQNCSKALELVADLKADIVTERIAKRACGITKSLNTLDATKQLTKTKTELLRNIIENGHSPTELSSVLQKDRTTISRQLNELKKQGLVDIKAAGRESFYKATQAARIAYELERMPEVN